jgi:hypothetical protein
VYSRVNIPELGENVILTTDCPVDFGIGFQPKTGDVSMVMS